MKIKTKLRVGIGVLFLLISSLCIFCLLYISRLSNDTKNILVANYNTLAYSREMLQALDEIPLNKDAVKVFEKNLQLQKNNITEVGEAEITRQLENDFYSFIKISSNPNAVSIRKDIYGLMNLNMAAIQRKSNKAQQTATNAYVWVSVSGTICFLIAFSLFMSFPGSIAEPIKILADSIKEIANKNYSLWLDFESHDEFGDVAIAFNTMAAKLREYEKSNLSLLLYEKKRIEILINKMNDPIIGLDENKKIVFANEQALEILALKAEDFIGKNAVEISEKNDLMRSLTKEIYNDEIIPRDAKKEPLKIYNNNKESYFEKEIIEIAHIPTGEKATKEVGHVILLKNITPFKELDVLKTNFISTVSHELKTPISSILISLKLLEDQRVGKINNEQEQLLRHIKEDSERLLNITGELLNMTQVETGKIQLNIEPSDPKEIVRLAIDANKIQAEQNNIKIELDYSLVIPLIIADAGKTAWVLTNFISNAVRYSYPDSRVIITVKQDKNKVLFSVQDFGKGIDSKYKDKIFDRYFRIPGNDKEGTGLGLAISKEFIEAQRGSIGLVSEIGKGSTFYFSLQLS